MPYTTRLLPPDEWPKLAGTELGAAPIPDSAKIVVVESEGSVVGCLALLPIYHIEGLWVAPSERGRGRVRRRLWDAMRTEAQQLGLGAVMALAGSDEVRGLIASEDGVDLPVTTHVLSTGER